MSKVFSGDVVAVDDISLEIADGEFMVLVGPSGCGKSTLLRIVAGLEELTAGEVLIGERVVTDLAPKERDIAMVFQNYALYPHMTVAQNIGIGLRVRRMPRREIRERVLEAARVLGLEALLDRKPAALSGGQRQRVAMGRAIVREPAAFLMDEPLSNLDAKLRVQMRAELARLRDRLRTTTLYVTHDQVEAMTLGDRVAVLRDGVLQQVDRPQALYQRPANIFVAAFIGSPSMNLVEATIDGGCVCFAEHRVPLADAGALAAYEGRKLVLGIRPADFEDADVWRADGAPLLEVTTEVTEDLGSEVNLIFTVEAPPVQSEQARAASAETAGEGDDFAPLVEEGRSLFTARVDPRTRARPGGRVRLSVDPARFHFFDPESGRALVARERAETALRTG